MNDQPQFRTVRHGYDPADVDRHVAYVAQAADTANAQAEELARRLAEANAQLADQQTQAASSPPQQSTFHDFGNRLGHLLAMAEEEAEEMRNAAVAEVHERLAEADKYAAETRAEAEHEAAGVLDQAHRGAAERAADVAGEQEQQRARLSAEALEHDRSLTERREHAEQLLQDRVEAVERELDEVRSHAVDVNSSARQQAERIVAEAREHAHRIRVDSDRELAQAIQHRDAINAQLHQVRQVLASWNTAGTPAEVAANGQPTGGRANGAAAEPDGAFAQH